MIIKIKKIDEILSNDLTLSERGILITILLLKESDPKLTLAKVKAKIKLHKVRKELIKLQDLELIKWSGYAAAKRAIAKKKANPKVVEIINFMNDLYRRGFDAESESTTKNLLNRIAEHTVEDIKLVVANRYKEWKNDAMMHVHLNPTTIFRPSKFDKYLEEAKRTRKGESLVQASNINLKNGDEITVKSSISFIDKDTYNVKVFQLDENGKRRGNGNEGIRYGKDIKRTIMIQENNFKRGNRREFVYIYIQK